MGILDKLWGISAPNAIAEIEANRILTCPGYQLNASRAFVCPPSLPLLFFWRRHSSVNRRNLALQLISVIFEIRIMVQNVLLSTVLVMAACLLQHGPFCR